MAKKIQKTIKRSTGDWMYCSFQAHPDEVFIWREIAGQDDRSLSWWIRDVLNRHVKTAAVARGQNNEGFTGKDVETVPSDGADDHSDGG